MYLSQLRLNPRHRRARADLADRYELHRTLLKAFPVQLPADERVLYRVDTERYTGNATVLVQSVYSPDWNAADHLQATEYLLEPPQMRAVMLANETGQRLPFRLQANPTIKRDGKRHALYDDDKLLAWLHRKGEQHGFRVDTLDVQVNKLGKFYGKRRSMIWHAVQFDGVLQVTDVPAFHDALLSGIGSAKSFGFGLLSVPLRNA